MRVLARLAVDIGKELIELKTVMASAAGSDAESDVMKIISNLRAMNIKAARRLENPSIWDDVSVGLRYCPVDYQQVMIDYQASYFSQNDRLALDASLVLFHDDRPAGIWPLMVIMEPTGERRLSSHGGAILPPLFARHLAIRSAKKLTAACVETVTLAWREFEQRDRICCDAFVASTGLSDWHDLWMLKSARIRVRHDLFTDLQRPLAEIRASFRKSFKPLISQGLKLWDAAVVSNPDERQWEEFHRLHIAVAGRVTRSDESWRRQLAAVSSGDAFFIVLRDAQSAMVGAALFHVTRDEGLYAVGAYDRSLFDKPLGHVAQFLAIEEMTRRGLRWYRIGSRAYPADQPQPSPKDISISDFKQGFSSHLMPCFRFDLGLH